MFNYVDTHCHLDLRQFDHDVSDVVRSAEQGGVGFLINPAIDVQSSAKIALMCQQFDSVYGAVGIHPNEIQPNYSNDLQQLSKLGEENKIKAIGEIGLDYYHKDVPYDIQKYAFQLQLDLASKLDLPVIIHSREAMADVEAILVSWAKKQEHTYENRKLGVMHSFEGDPETAVRLYKLGFFIGIGGPITYKNAELKRSVVTSLPLEAIVLETDSPYLAPEPFRGKRNMPAYIPLIGKRTAIIKGCSEGEVALITTQNALTLFNIGAVH